MADQEAAPVGLPPNPPRLPEQLKHNNHKNHLQQYAQRSAIALPIYETINQGSPHAPKFRSSVKVDGAVYRSFHTFSHRKEAEQDVAKFALDYISKKIKDERCPLIYEDIIFCKSILNEFATKMNLDMPTYTTTQTEGLLPVFISSLVFDGKTYTGTPARNKKEAEQLAARTVLKSFLGASGSGKCLYEIIKSKSRIYPALHKVEESKSVKEAHMPTVVTPGINYESSTRKRKDLDTSTSQLAENVTVTPPPFHEFKKPKEEVLFETGARAIGSAAPLLVEFVGGCPDRLAIVESKPPYDVQPMQQNQLTNESLLVQPSLISHSFQGTAQLTNESLLVQPSLISHGSQGTAQLTNESLLVQPPYDVQPMQQNQLTNESLLVQPSLISLGSQGTAQLTNESLLVQPSLTSHGSQGTARLTNESLLVQPSLISHGSQGTAQLTNESLLVQPPYDVQPMQQNQLTNESLLVQPSLISHSSQGTAQLTNESLLVQPSLISHGSQGTARLTNESLLVQPSLISHGSQGTAIDISVGRKYPRGKNKKRRRKKILNGEQLQMTPTLTMNQAPSCSVAL